ncbi:hypothetical protein M758_11G033500, partial [Ceratodon purpureus]
MGLRETRSFDSACENTVEAMKLYSVPVPSLWHASDLRVCFLLRLFENFHRQVEIHSNGVQASVTGRLSAFCDLTRPAYYSKHLQGLFTPEYLGSNLDTSAT